MFYKENPIRFASTMLERIASLCDPANELIPFHTLRRPS